jgi:Zn-dependent protease with chaperone function
MERVIKRLVDIGHERRLRQLLVANAVEVSDKQVPQLWDKHCATAAALSVNVPDLFVTQAPLANALAVGAKRPMIVLFSGLVRDYTSEEVDSVLGHEMGHVLCEHNYYQTGAQLLAMLLRSGGLVGPAGLPVRAMYMVLLEWSRMAELSADRASALVVGDPRVTCQMLMRMAGGALDGMSLDAFLAQAARYEEEDDLLARWSRAWVEVYVTHPFAVRRAQELMRWVAAGEYDRIRDGNYVRRGQEPPVPAEMGAAAAHYRDRFMKMLGNAAGGVDKVLRQLENWLNRDTDA